VLRTLAGQGVTVVLSSHLLAEVAQVCDQIAVLADGRLVRQGTVADLAAGGDLEEAFLAITEDHPDQAASSSVGRHGTNDGGTL
jgi:ABC-2 type transport system ATP-binding protein